MGHRALGIELVDVREASPPHAANDQALGVVTTPFIPEPPKMVTSSSESASSQGEGSGGEEEDNAEAGKSETETSSDEQEASEGEDKQECPHTQDTLTGVSQLFGEHRH